VAFPVIETTNQNSTAAGATHAITMPSGISVGDLLLLFFATDGDNTVTDWDGFTQLGSESNGTAASFHIGWKIAVGSDTCTLTVSVTTEPAAHIVYRISGHDSGQAPEISVVVEAADDMPDPDTLSPTGGAKDYLWIHACGHDHTDVITAWNANFTLSRIHESEGSNGGCGCGVSAMEDNTATKDPTYVTLTGSEQWVAWTVAVHPLAGGTNDDTRRAEVTAFAETGAEATRKGEVQVTEVIEDVRRAEVLAAFGKEATRRSSVTHAVVIGDTRRAELVHAAVTDDTRRAEITHAVVIDDTRKAEVLAAFGKEATRRASVNVAGPKDADRRAEVHVAVSVDDIRDAVVYVVKQVDITRRASVTVAGAVDDVRRAEVSPTLGKEATRKARITHAAVIEDIRRAEISIVIVPDITRKAEVTVVVGIEETRRSVVYSAVSVDDVRRVSVSVVELEEIIRRAIVDVYGAVEAEDVRKAEITVIAASEAVRRAHLFVSIGSILLMEAATTSRDVIEVVARAREID